MITRADLIKKIKTELPQIKKPEKYADVILAGVALKAYDSASSRKRSDFLEAGKIQEHIFTNSYMTFGLLIPIREASKIFVIMSTRVGLIFSFSRARQTLEHERSLLFSHINSEPHIKRLITKPLKLSPNAALDAIKNKMYSGNEMKQTSTYERVYTYLTRNGVKPRGYMWMGVRTIPISHYYLSKKSLGFLGKK